MNELKAKRVDSFIGRELTRYYLMVVDSKRRVWKRVTKEEYVKTLIEHERLEW